MNINEGWGILVNCKCNKRSTHTVTCIPAHTVTCIELFYGPHDAWALIALMALLSAILVLGLLWKYMGLMLGFGTFDTHSGPRAQDFTNDTQK